MKKTTILSPLLILLTASPMSFALQDMKSASVSCIASLCGVKNPMAHPFETDPTLKTEAKTKVQEVLRKPINNYMGRIIHQALITDSLIKHLMEAKDQISVPTEVASVIQAFRYVNRLQNYSSAFEVSATGQITVNREKLKAADPKLTEPELDAIVSLAPILTFIVGYRPVFEGHLEVALKVFHAEMSIAEGMKYEAEQILQTQKILTLVAPITEYTQPVGIVVQRAASGATLSESEKRIFLGKIRSRFLIGLLLQKEIQDKFAKIPLNIPEALQEFEKQYNASRQAQAVRNPKTIRKLFQDAVEACTNKITDAYGALPTQAQKNNFLQIFERIRLASQQMVEERTKTSLADQFKMEMILPTSKENLLPDLKANFEQDTAKFDNGIRYMKRMNLKDPSVLSSVFAIAMTFKDADLLGDAVEFCDQAKVAMLDDAALPKYKIVNLSWPTILHPELGVGVIAHELGHVASGNWNEILQPEKQCLKGKQGSEKYLEEDFADLFSTEVIRRLGSKGAGVTLQNFSCALVARDENGWKPAELTNAVENDSHSSGFYRLFAVASRTTGLTAQCRNYLTEARESRFLPYCAWGK